MKKLLLMTLVLCLLLSGCGKVQNKAEEPAAPETETTETVENTENAETTESAEPAEPALTVRPLPDTTMENLTDAILAVSLEEGGAYVDDTGKMQMDLTIYTYDLYDMAEFSQLKEGDTIVIQGKDVVVTSLERTDLGLVLINGGMEAGGYDFTHSDSGVYYETGFNDVKSWYEVGKETIRVSTEMTGVDNGDPEMGEVELFPGGFLIGEVTDYNFTPYNTTVRVEDGQIVYMERIYTP